jgi:hypothetical protein
MHCTASAGTVGEVEFPTGRAERRHRLILAPVANTLAPWMFRARPSPGPPAVMNLDAHDARIPAVPQSKAK